MRDAANRGLSLRLFSRGFWIIYSPSSSPQKNKHAQFSSPGLTLCLSPSPRPFRQTWPPADAQPTPCSPATWLPCSLRSRVGSSDVPSEEMPPRRAPARVKPVERLTHRAPSQERKKKTNLDPRRERRRNSLCSGGATKTSLISEEFPRLPHVGACRPPLPKLVATDLSR